MLKPFLEIYRHGNIIWATTLYDIKTKYAGSVLGYIWLFLYPVLFLTIYAVTYIMVFKVRLHMLSPYEYVLLIFCGLIPFLGFSEAVGRGTVTVTSNTDLIKNTLFPIELMPVNIVLSSMTVPTVGFLLILPILLYFNKLGCSSLFLPVVMFEQVIFTVGLVWILAALNVFFRDFGQVISIVLLMLMIISPIAYTEEMVPAALRTFLYLNPLYYMVILYQKLLMFNTLDEKLFSIFTIISFGHFVLGYHFFTRLKGVFSDHV